MYTLYISPCALVGCAGAQSAGKEVEVADNRERNRYDEGSRAAWACLKVSSAYWRSMIGWKEAAHEEYASVCRRGDEDCSGVLPRWDPRLLRMVKSWLLPASVDPRNAVLCRDTLAGCWSGIRSHLGRQQSTSIRWRLWVEDVRLIFGDGERCHW